MQIQKNVCKYKNACKYKKNIRNIFISSNTRVLQVLTTQPNTQNVLQNLTTQPNTETLQVTQSTTEMFPGNQISDGPNWDLLIARKLPYALLPSNGRQQSSSSGNLA